MVCSAAAPMLPEGEFTTTIPSLVAAGTSEETYTISLRTLDPSARH